MKLTFTPSWPLYCLNKANKSFETSFISIQSLTISYLNCPSLTISKVDIGPDKDLIFLELDHPPLWLKSQPQERTVGPEKIEKRPTTVALSCKEENGIKPMNWIQTWEQMEFLSLLEKTIHASGLKMTWLLLLQEWSLQSDDCIRQALTTESDKF